MANNECEGDKEAVGKQKKERRIDRFCKLFSVNWNGIEVPSGWEAAKDVECLALSPFPTPLCRFAFQIHSFGDVIRVAATKTGKQFRFR